MNVEYGEVTVPRPGGMPRVRLARAAVAVALASGLVACGSGQSSAQGFEPKGGEMTYFTEAPDNASNAVAGSGPSWRVKFPAIPGDTGR